jgi:integrase
MPKLKLTDAALKSLKLPPAGQADHFDTLLPSFGVRVTFKGQKTFFVFDRVGGKLKRMTLGRYPAIGLAEARDKARLWKASAERGADPVVEANQQKASANAGTFGAVAESFLASEQPRLRQSSYRDHKTFLQGPHVADWTGRQLASISRADVAAVLKKMERHPATSNRSFASLRRFFNWCIDRGLIEHAPTDRMHAQFPQARRDRVLKPDELAIVATAIRDDDATLRVMYGIEKVTGLADLWRDFFKALLLTGQRRNEVAGMTWGELRDLDGKDAVWELPGDRAKNHLPHIVPLSSPVIAILKRRRAQADAERKAAARDKRDGEDVQRPFVFSGSGGREPISGFSRAKAALDKRTMVICEALGRPSLKGWAVHDLRRTMVTGMNEMGIAPHVVEAVVNHVSGTAKRGVAGVYNQALYLPERRAALNAWAEHVAKLKPPVRK